MGKLIEQILYFLNKLKEHDQLDKPIARRNRDE